MKFKVIGFHTALENIRQKNRTIETVSQMHIKSKSTFTFDFSI